MSQPTVAGEPQSRAPLTAQALSGQAPQPDLSRIPGDLTLHPVVRDFARKGKAISTSPLRLGKPDLDGVNPTPGIGKPRIV